MDGKRTSGGPAVQKSHFLPNGHFRHRNGDVCEMSGEKDVRSFLCPEKGGKELQMDAETFKKIPMDRKVRAVNLGTPGRMFGKTVRFYKKKDGDVFVFRPEPRRKSWRKSASTSGRNGSDRQRSSCTSIPIRSRPRTIRTRCCWSQDMPR